jgi:hypothetical protein
VIYVVASTTPLRGQQSTRSHSKASHAASRQPPAAPSLPAATREWQTRHQRKCQDSFAGGGDDRGSAPIPLRFSALGPPAEGWGILLIKCGLRRLRKKAGGVRRRRPCRMAPPMALGLRLRIALSSTAAREFYPMPVSFAQSSSTPCWRPQSDKSRGCGGRAPAITPAGAAVHVCWLMQDVQRSGPQPFQGEPRGESPPAGCPKPTRRNAGASSDE